MNLIERIRMFLNIGYFNPKYVYLANIANTDTDNDDEINRMLQEEASKYLNKGDKIFDALYIAIYEFKSVQKMMKGEIENNE